MGQCVSLKAGVVVAASEHHGSPSYRIMDKPSKNHNDSKGASKKGAPLTRGTATSFGFRRRPTSGIPMPVTAGSYGNDVTGTMHQRSKSAGPPEQERRRDEDNCHQRFHSSSSGRSTPRLAPPKKEAVTSGNALRTNRFGFRQPQQRYTNKVGDICSSHTASHYNQDKVHSLQQQHHQQQQHQQIQQMHQMQHQQQREIQQDNYIIGRQSSRSSQAHPTVPSSKLRPSPVNNPPAYGGHSSPMTIETDRRGSGIPEPISKYTLHTSHLPLPQYAIRMNEANPKVAKTAANQSRQVSTASKCPTSSKESSGTEDSGVGSQQGYPVDHETVRGLDYFDSSAAAAAMVRRSHGRPRNLRMVLSGKSFDVRDVEDDSTVTEISVIPLPKSFATSANLNSGFVRDRTVQYQRILNKDNRYTDSTTSMSTTSSEGYGEGLGEEKVYKDRSHTEKTSSIKSDFSPPSSDDPEYGHGEAMADEYSLSSSDECRANSNQHLKTITNAAKSGSLPKNTLRSVLLTIEDPAFAAAAATTTSLIDDETSPADSLVDSLTASITQSDGKNSRKECIMDRSGNTLEDDSPGTPTNASNSLSLSEGREFFDDEIADQPGLTFDETLRTGTADTHSGGRTGNVVTENSHTLVESAPKLNMPQGRIAENGSVRRIARAESVDTLSPCESITSDDFMLDYDCSEGHSDDETNRPLDYSTVIYDLDEVTMRDVIRELSAPKGTSQNHSNSNLANNNISTGNNNNNNHNTATGLGNTRASRLLRSRSGTDSPRSLDSVRIRQVSSPFRPVFTGNVQSPSLDSVDDGSLRIERFAYHQDIVSIKTSLLKLMRLVQESGENGLTRAETLNPFNTTMVNGLFHNLNEDGTTDTSGVPVNGTINTTDELVDLRRQVVFLQGQLEDKDRTIQQLQMQISKHQDLSGTDSQSQSSLSMNSSCLLNKDMCNATTQTEKIRSVSAGPSLLQSLPQDGGMGPLVSWSDSWNRQRAPSLADINSSRNLRKLSDRSPRTSRPRHEETSNRLNGFSEKTASREFLDESNSQT